MLKYSARIPTVEYGYFEVESDTFDEFVQGVVNAQAAAVDYLTPPPAPAAPQQQPQQSYQQPAQLPQVNGQGAPPWAAPDQQAQQQFVPPGYQQAPQGWPQVPPPGQQGWQPSAPQQGAPTGAPRCNHGERKHVTGNGKNGAWAAWMCPTPKGAPDKCDPEWIK